jgi:acetyltransferase-like isoleucine patch superfamily enzyme
MDPISTNQLRKHLKFKLSNLIRLLYLKISIGYCGNHIWIDKNVVFERYKKKMHIADNVIIKEGSHICVCNKDASISIGKNTTVGYYNFFFASKKIEIGDNCLIAPFVYIVDSDHQIKRETLINQQPNISAEIVIGNDVWIASNVTILKGVKIGNGSVIAANSVVNKDVAPYTIVGGSPAKFISSRD